MSRYFFAFNSNKSGNPNEQPYWPPKRGETKRTKPVVPKRTVYFSVTKGEYNHGLGTYVGNRGDVRSALNKIEDETGSRPVEMGTESGKMKQKPMDLSVTREDYERANG